MIDGIIMTHNNVDKKTLYDIIVIKKAFGLYSFKSQLNWMSSNLESHDRHFLMYEDGYLLGYANLMEKYISINNENVQVIGLGNVCVSEKGSGFGRHLITLINSFLIAHNKIGFLFCKPEICGFYERLDWVKIKTSPKKDTIQMLFNCKDLSIDSHIIYTGSVF